MLLRQRCGVLLCWGGAVLVASRVLHNIWAALQLVQVRVEYYYDSHAPPPSSSSSSSNSVRPSRNGKVQNIDDEGFGSSLDFDAASSRFDSYNACRVALQESILRPQISTWIAQDVPILQDVVKIDGIHHVLFYVIDKVHSEDYGKWQYLKWQCHHSRRARDHDDNKDDDADDDDETVVDGVVVTEIDRERMRQRKIFIAIQCSTENVTSVSVWTNTPHNEKGTRRFLEYDVRTWQACENLRAQSLAPTFVEPGSIGACTAIAFDECRKRLWEWVEYHRLIGIQHFWVYLNEKWSLEGLPLRSYITYVPWDISLRYHTQPNNGEPYDQWLQDFAFQVSQVNNCLYHAKASGIDWLASFDVDEYIHVTRHQTDRGEKNNDTSTLLLDLLQSTGADAVSFNSIPYGSNKRKPESNPPDVNHGGLLMDYVWRKNRPLHTYKKGRFKIILHPRQALALGVHRVFKGPDPVWLEEKTQGYLNHYKNPKEGVFYGTTLMRDAALPNKFRDKLLRALGREETKEI